MMSMLDCQLNYFGLDEDGRPTYRRYFCYRISAGPGPTAGSAVASIHLLAAQDRAGAFPFCNNLYAVSAGGPAAAIAKAIRDLDAFHGADRLRRVQSDVRGEVAPTREECPRLSLAH